MKFGQGRIGRGADKGRMRAAWRGRTDERGVVSFRN